jgi:hypothetical protein
VAEAVDGPAAEVGRVAVEDECAVGGAEEEAAGDEKAVGFAEVGLRTSATCSRTWVERMAWTVALSRGTRLVEGSMGITEGSVGAMSAASMIAPAWRPIWA